MHDWDLDSAEIARSDKAILKKLDEDFSCPITQVSLAEAAERCFAMLKALFSIASVSSNQYRMLLGCAPTIRAALSHAITGP